MTNTNVPVIDGSWLEQGQYIISVVGNNIELVKSGNIAAPRREVDDETLKRCSFMSRFNKNRLSIHSKAISTGPCRME